MRSSIQRSLTDTHIGLCLFLRTTVWSSHTLGANKDVNKENFSKLCGRTLSVCNHMLCPSQSFLLCFHQRWESHLIGRYILHVKSKYENNIIIIKITAWPLALSCVSWFGWCCALWSAHRLSPDRLAVSLQTLSVSFSLVCCVFESRY